MYFKLEFGKPKERRSINDPLNYQAQNPEHPSSNPNRWLLDIYGGRPTSAGVRVDPETAPAHSAVYRSVQLLSSTIASFPFGVIRSTKGSKDVAIDHPVHQLLWNPSELYTGYIWRENMMQFCLLWGNGYSEIIRDEYFTPIALDLFQSKDVRPYIGIRADGRKTLRYEITEHDVKTGTDKKRQVDSMNMVHIPCLSFDGIAGRSIVSVARENIGLGLAAEKFGGNFYKNNAAFSGVFTNPGELNEEAYHRLKESLEDKSQYGEKAKPLLLESGLEFKSMSMPLADAQFLDSRKFQIVEIARMFGLPPHLLGDLDRATNNNIEQQSLEFISYTIWSWCEKWEAEINRKLFTEKEKQSGKYYSHFDFGGLVRGDSKQRSDYYRTMFAIGCMSPNEIRDKEEMNPREGGDDFFIPLNMADVDSVSGEVKNPPAGEPPPGAPGVNGKPLNGLKVK
jgi:HK97 family phage portal protein